MQFADAVELVLSGEIDAFAAATESPTGDEELFVRRLPSGPVRAVLERRAVAKPSPDGALAEREMLALVAQLTDNAVIITDADGRIEWVNAGFTRITEYELQEVIGKTPGSFLQGPATDLRTVNVMREALQRREGFDVQILNYAKSGRHYWLNIEVRPVRDAAGDVVRFIAIESDITAMREKESQLRAAVIQARDLARDVERSQQLLDLAVRGADLALWQLNPLTGEGSRSDRWLSMLGYDDELPTGYATFVTLLHPLDSARVGEALEACVKGEVATYECTFRIRHKDGSYRWVRARGGVLERTPEGEPKLMAGTVQDVHDEMIATERREAEQALLQTVLATVPASIFWKDRDSRYLGCNEAFARDAGLASPSEIVGLNDTDLPWRADQTDDYRADDREVMETGRPLIGREETQRCADGRLQHLLTSKTPLVDATGALRGVLGIIQDVTPLKHAERTAREAEERVRSIFRSAADAILVLHCSGTIVEANASSEALFALPSEKLLGQCVERFLPGVIDAVRSDATNGEGGGELRFRREVEAVDASGRRFAVELSLSAFEDEEHRYYTCILHDVTERHRVQSRAAAFARIIDESPAEVYLIDGETLQIVEANRGACQNLGYGKHELIGRHPFDVNPDCDEPVFRRRLQEVESHPDRRLEYDARFRRKDGSVYPVHICLSRSTMGARAVYLALATDLTKREEHERQIAQAQKLESLGEMAAGIAHEINTPMQYVSGNVEFLKNCYERLFAVVDKYGECLSAPAADWDKRREETEQLIEQTRFRHIRSEAPAAIEEAAEGVQRVIEIVRAMKNFCHPGTQEKIPTDLNRLLASAAILTRNRWKFHATVELDLATDLPDVPALPAELSQVVLNLLVNAADAIAERLGEAPKELGKIVVRTSVEDDDMVLEVIDDGCGIRGEHLDRVFEPFFTTKDVGKGTGQGLALCYDVVVKKHGGRIEVQSELGEGSRFSVRLPLHPKLADSLRIAEDRVAAFSDTPVPDAVADILA